MARKIVGWYVMRDGEQIAWFSLRARARAYAKQHGGSIVEEYA